MEQRPIEIDFPIEQVNEIAEVEAHAKEKFRPIYFIHKWWARRLGCVFRTIVLYSLIDENSVVLDDNDIWRKVTKEELKDPWLLYLKDVDLGGKIVLDPMMGGGTTVIEALRLGCKVVAQDLNPVAWFLVKKMVEVADIDVLKKVLKELESNIAEEIKKYYKTICPECLRKYLEINRISKAKIFEDINQNFKENEEINNIYSLYNFKENKGLLEFENNIFADSMYYFWIKELNCQNCGQKVPLFKGYMLAQKRDSKGYHVICPDCGNVFEVKDYKKDTVCQKCTKKFNPDTDGNVQGRYYICQKCGYKNEIVENIKRMGKPQENLYAVEYYCPSCNEKGYKKVDDFDTKLFEKAQEEYIGIEKEWLGKYIPSTNIPKGQETYPRLIENHGYKYWKDMFNSRQLLSLGKLYKTILNLNIDENIKEFFIITFSKSLEYNNLFCEYRRKVNAIYNMFKAHVFHPTMNPVENNVWGADYGNGSFKSHFNLLIHGKDYNLNSFEKYIFNGKTLEKKLKTRIIGINGNVLNSSSNIQLTCGDSSYLDIQNESIDAVITDPPYYGNVMYSELSEFYYSWLRLSLRQKYDYFQSEHVPNSAEVIVNNVQNKGEKEFVDGLTAVFKEIYRKLKKDGIMVFTFHHQEEKAWGAVLQSVLNSNFYINSIYPVQSEKNTSTHILNKANVRYDMVIVCRKRSENPEKKYWSTIEDQIYLKVEDELKRLEKNKKNLSSEDIFVVAIGKCLEIFSKYYPEVYKNDKKVSVDEALMSIREIVDSQIMHTRFNQVASETDVMTSIYIFYLAGKTSLSYESLNKALKMRNIEVKEVIDSGLVEKQGSQLFIMVPSERKDKLIPKKVESLSAIDKVQFLYGAWQSEGKFFTFEKNLSEDEKSMWKNEKVLKTLEYLFEIEKDNIYLDLLKILKDRW